MTSQAFRESRPSRELVTVVATAIIVWVVFNLFGQQVLRAYALGNDQLTDTGDSYSEANDIRAGEGYAAMGLTSNAGLPDANYGNRFEHVGGKHDTLLCESPERCIYLHYPPLPELVLGVATKWFGVGRLFVYRLFPITLGLIALSALGAALFKAIGPVRAAVVMWLFGNVPMTSNMMHVVALHEYAVAFFLLEMAVLLVAVSAPVLRTWHLVALGVAAFLEGWTAFDYVFLVSLAPLCVFLAFKDIGNPVSRNRLLKLIAVASGAYALALLMHFVQVAVFLGGVREAFSNFAAAGKNRSVGPSWVVPPISGGLGLVLYYWVNLLPGKMFYDGNFVALLAVVVTLMWPKKASASLGRLGRVSWTSSWQRLASFLLMLALACGWIVTMQQHSSIHGHFLPRLFTSVVLWAYVLVAWSVSFEPAGERAQITPADGATG